MTNDKSVAEIEQDSIKLVAEKLGLHNGFPQTLISTYQYQKFLKNNNKVLISKSTFIDLLEKDSVFVLSIQVNCFTEIYVDVVCKENQIKDILEELNSTGFHYQIMENYSLVVEITSIEKIKYGIVSSIEDDSFISEDGNNYVPNLNVKLSLEAGDSFIFKGVLIDKIQVNK